jgi:hypothetical protein
MKVLSHLGALPRKRLAFHPAKFEPALTLARSDWQKRHVDEDAIAHGSAVACLAWEALQYSDAKRLTQARF